MTNLFLKAVSLFVGKPLKFLNGVLDGKKSFLGGFLVILPALACIIKFLLDNAPIDLADINNLIKSVCMRQLGEGLLAIGLTHKFVKFTRVLSNIEKPKA